jgi:hypothetical protein
MIESEKTTKAHEKHAPFCFHPAQKRPVHASDESIEQT